MSEKVNIHNEQFIPVDAHLPSLLDTLVRDCIAWKRPSQRIFYETYAPAIYNIIRRYIFQEDSAQEILNDTFYKIFTRLETYSAKGPIEAWMRRIAVNTITDFLRKLLRQEQPIKQEVTEADGYVENEAVNNLSFAELIGCLAKLTEIQRVVFNLAVFENLTHKEIGVALSISTGNSRWILKDARNSLKKIITGMK